MKAQPLSSPLPASPRLEAILPSDLRSWRNTSNNKNAIKKLNEAPINTRQEDGKNGAEEKSRKKERERGEGKKRLCETCGAKGGGRRNG